MSLSLAPRGASIRLDGGPRGDHRPRDRRKWRESQAATASIVLAFVDANPSPEISGIDERPGYTNYYLSDAPRQWIIGGRQFASVRYGGLYPGIDLLWRGAEGQIEYDLVVHPGANLRAVRLRFDGLRSLSLDADGRLILATTEARLSQGRPVVYQDIEGVRRKVPARYRLVGRLDVAFEVGAYDHRYPLIIDPTLVYSENAAGGTAIAVDTSGNVYLTGSTTAPGRDPLRSPPVAFVKKLSPSGTEILYTTYIGGTGGDVGSAIAIDSTGSVWVTGEADSKDFPVLNAFQPKASAFREAFVSKLDPTGKLVYSTYLGGAGDDYGNGVAIDAAGSAYIAGGTSSTNFPTVPTRTSPGFAAFVSKFSASGALVYSRYLGGSGLDEAEGIAVDTAGNSWVTGFTYSTDFPVVNACQRQLSGDMDGFVTKLDATGSSIIYSTYLGGSSYDRPLGIAVDAAGGPYVTGQTNSVDFPTKGAIQPTKGGKEDAFVSKLSADGSALAYSTYVGGTAEEMGRRIAVDLNGKAVVVGFTLSFDFPTKDAYQPKKLSLFNDRDGFVLEMNDTGSSFVFSTYLGGSWEGGGRTPTVASQAYGVAVDLVGDAYVTGGTYAGDFPITVLPSAKRAGETAWFVTKFLAPFPVRVQPTWQPFFAVDSLETPYVGDFNGDRKTDIITFTRQNPNAIGDVYVALSDGSKFGPNAKWHDFFAITTDETVIIGDYDGDGKDDIATWLGKTSRQVYVALSTGSGMLAERAWVSSVGTDPTDRIFAGDTNGDGKDDLIAFARKQGKVYVALSDGTKFGAPVVWHGFFAVSTYERPRIADVNGDGKVDIVTFATDSPTAFGDVYVATSDGTKFVGPTGAPNDSSKWHDFFAIRPTEEIRTGDLNGDGKDDSFTFLPERFAQCYTVLSLGTSMSDNVLWAEAVAPLLGAGDNVYVGDVNGDGKADIIIFAQKEGKVFVSLAP